MRKILIDAFETKRWDSREGYPRSGAGSTLEATEQVRQALPGLFKKYGVQTFFDAPCGDWFWMQNVDLEGVRYIGADISTEVLNDVSDEFANDQRQFLNLDITHDPLPDADMMMCRDCLFHLKWDLRWAFFENFLKSNIRYLLLTMHHGAINLDLRNNGDFAKFNPCVGPFNLAPPLEMIHEAARVNLDPAFVATPRGSWQRSMGVWHRDQIEEALSLRTK